jgi:hypothetical protein
MLVRMSARHSRVKSVDDRQNPKRAAVAQCVRCEVDAPTLVGAPTAIGARVPRACLRPSSSQARLPWLGLLVSYHCT